MRRRRRRGVGLILFILLAFAAIMVIGSKLVSEEPEEIDPHAGQVLINDGFNDVWITPYEDVEVNDLKKEDFDKAGDTIVYTGEDYDTILGIDVSEWQGEIDWKRVAESGIQFAYIRTGCRGYTQGSLMDDARYRYNIREAMNNNIQVGVYFFSQAVNVGEAIDEAKYLLKQIKNFDISLPIMYDWEKLEDVPDARTNDLDPSIIGDCGVAFCETVKAAGYDAGVYFNRQLGYYSFDLSRLKDFKFWLAVPGDFPDFYYAGNIWQYTHEGTVPGINGEVDMNLMFIKRPEPTPEPDASPAP